MYRILHWLFGWHYVRVGVDRDRCTFTERVRTDGDGRPWVDLAGVTYLDDPRTLPDGVTIHWDPVSGHYRWIGFFGGHASDWFSNPYECWLEAILSDPDDPEYEAMLKHCEAFLSLTHKEAK